MGKMPESVKTVRIGATVTPAAFYGEKFDIKIAPDEIMLLLSLYYSWYGTAGVGNQAWNIGLWRKSDSNPPGDTVNQSSADMIWSTWYKSKFVTESMLTSDREHFVFPKPMVLVRPPRLAVLSATFTATFIEMRLYYQLVNVDKKELTKLLIKDHA